MPIRLLAPGHGARKETRRRPRSPETTMSLVNVGHRKPSTLPASGSAADAARLMETRNVGAVIVLDGIRRLPIVGHRGELIDIVTHDDLVRPMGLGSSELAESIAMLPPSRKDG
jgi:CBS domain-containing protein